MITFIFWPFIFSIVNAENVQRELEMLSQDAVTNDVNGNIARSTLSYSAADNEAKDRSPTTSIAKNVVNGTGLSSNKLLLAFSKNMFLWNGE